MPAAPEGACAGLIRRGGFSPLSFLPNQKRLSREIVWQPFFVSEKGFF